MTEILAPEELINYNKFIHKWFIVFCYRGKCHSMVLSSGCSPFRAICQLEEIIGREMEYVKFIPLMLPPLPLIEERMKIELN